MPDTEVLATLRDILSNRYDAVLKAVKTLDRRNTGRVLRSQLRQCLRTYCVPLSTAQFNSLVPQYNASAFVIKTGSTTQWQADLTPKEMAASDIRNRRHVQPLLTWSTNTAHPDRVENDGKVDYIKLLADLAGVQASGPPESPVVEMRPLTLDQLEYHLKLKSRQDSEMELNQDPTGVKSDGPTETMERRQEVRESESARERQEVTGRETTAPLADAINQLSTFLTRVKISDGAESAIPPFDGAYSATQFFQTFDRKMEDASMGEQEKLLRLPNYLVRQPLELFRKLRLADRSYFQVRQILLDLYPESSEASFAKYFAMKLTGQANLETYYREKNRHGIATRTSTRGDPRDADRRTAIQRPAPSPRSASREPRRVVPTGTADPRAQSHPDAQVHGMHLFRRPTASSAARDTGTANADIDQSRRPTKKSGQCKRSQNHQFRLHHNQVKPETPQPDSPFETEVGSLNQLTVKLFLAPNVSCPFLIDTGASLSIVPYNIYHMLKTHLPNLTLEGHSLHLQTLNGFAKTMGKLSIPLTIGQISRKEYFHVVNAPLPFGILSINSLHKFRLTIDFNKCTILQLGAPLSTLSYHFNHVSNVCTYWQCQAMSQKFFPTSQLSAYDNHCVHSLRKPHLSTCPFFTKANCPFYMPSNNQTTTTSTYEPVQNAPTQRDNSHTKNIGDHTPLHNSHMTNPHNELDTHTNTQQNPLPHAYYNTTPNTHYTPQFTTLLQRYTHIFSQDKFNVPCLRIPPVKIPTNSKKIITIRPYRVPICDQQEIRNQIQQMLENGIIEQSFSPFSSPVTLVTKRDKTKRFCIDYRKVNELISSDVHPLPRIEDILDHLAQAKYFSTADISSAYWQVPIHPDSRPLLAFATFEGLYQPTRLPFGLKTSPQIYERAISQVLQRHGLDCVAHYFDDFIIYSNTLEEHQNHLRQFFAFCEAEKLQLNFAKCEFFKQSINFLGYTITAGTITPLTRNTDIIHAIKQPHNRKTLQSFLGAVNVYNKFIPEYARLRAPLNNLLKKDVVWNWNEACQEAFIDLKGNLTQHPILHLYKEGLPCQVYCDASTLGIAGILKQVHPDGNVYPVQYFSRTLRPHEKNYSISELECLAIVESVEKFRIYLMGRKFTIFSDHHALQWLKTIKNPSGRLFRWSLRLSSYEYEVRYIKGKLQYEADLLSRNPFCGFLDATLIKTHQSPPSKESSLTIDHNGLHTVSRKGVTKIILPKPLIQQLLQTVHTQYNHPGISQMSRIISTQYYWQGMSKDIKQKVKTCPTCQLTKRPVGPTYGELSQPPESKEPFDLLSLDTIAGFAKYGNTKIYLHVVVDHFSRYAWAFPSKSTSTTTYQQVLKRVFQDGSPKRLLTDRAPAFTSPKFRSFLLNRNIHPLLTTSNNPQANGLCERLNATLTGKLRLLHLENPKVAWTKLVKKVTLIYNKTPHSTTGFPPIYLMFGILPPEISNHNTPYPDIDKARKIAHTRTQNKHLQDKNTYDQRHKQPHFEVGDLVLVKLYHHPNTGKLAPYFTGPHTILEIISPNVVRIDRPNQPLQRDTDTIHVNKLKLYTEKIHYISPPAVSTYHIKHNPNYTFPFKHLTPELFPTESLRFKPTSSEPFRHLDPAIFATRRFTSLFPDVKNCKPDNQLNHITPPPKDIKQENYEPTNHSNSTINKRSQDITDSPVTKSRQDSGRQGTSKQIDHCLYRKMEQGREEESKEPMKTDPDYESGDNPTFPKKENTLGRTQEIVSSQEDVTPPPPVSDVLGRLTTTLHQLSAVTGHRERWNRYDGSYEAQSFFTNYDAQADRAQLQYSTRLRKPPNLLQAPLRVTNTRAYIHENLKEVLKAFFMFDLNHDGMVQKREVKRVLENYAFRIPDEQFNLLWHRYDPNHTGLICYEDFLVRLGINAGRCQLFLPSHVMSRALCWSDRDVETFLDKARVLLQTIFTNTQALEGYQYATGNGRWNKGERRVSRYKKRREYAAQENLDDPCIQGLTLDEVVAVFLKKLKKADTRRRLELACETLDSRGSLSDSQFHSLLNHLVLAMSPELYRQLMDACVPPRALDIRRIDWRAFLDRYCQDASSGDPAVTAARPPPAVLVQKAIEKLKLNVPNPKERFQDIYTRVDKQGSRITTRSEARRALQTTDFSLPDEEWHALWNVLDSTHVNVVRVDDLLALLEVPQASPANVIPPGTVRAQLNSQVVPAYRDSPAGHATDTSCRQDLSQLKGGPLLRKLRSLVTEHRAAIMKVLRGLDWLRCGTLDQKAVRRTLEKHTFPLTDEQWEEILSHVEVHRGHVDYALLMDSFVTGPGEETTRWLRDVSKLVSQAPKHRKVPLGEEEALEMVREGVRARYNALLRDLRQVDHCSTGLVAAQDFRRVLNRNVVRLSDPHFERLWAELPRDLRGRLQYLDWLDSVVPQPAESPTEVPEPHRDLDPAREAPVELLPCLLRAPRHLSGAGVNIVKCYLGLRSYRLYREKTLSEAAMKNRLDKAKKLFSMIRVGRRLSDILWMGEKIFIVEVAHNSQNHRQLLPPGNQAYRKRRGHTRLNSRNLLCSGPESLLKARLVFIDRNVKIDSQVYQDVILRDFDDSLLPAAWVLEQRYVAFKLPGSKPDGLLRVELLGAKCLLFSKHLQNLPEDGFLVKGDPFLEFPVKPSLTLQSRPEVRQFNGHLLPSIVININ
ncbi:hypothetical protein LAZ67_1008215 [Cordylochernes scorpioides]|uniref:RNA-directed DNA polymerase n=1 Tax=Cordylochernes scorpioides TaxID=51811 RepID=A0ABY6K1M5_9ARAC|nr:hypothetical protein LAZ67_1008215 [Cordylochernes scorpioides]